MATLKLDYSLETPEERKALVEQILQEDPNPSSAYLEILADYLVLCMEKQEKKNVDYSLKIVCRPLINVKPHLKVYALHLKMVRTVYIIS